MKQFPDDQEWQRALLHHPAFKPSGVDPMWKIVAIIGWGLVFILTAMIASAAGKNPGLIRVPSVAENSVVTKQFLDAMEQVESGMDAGAVGDKGRARGSFQFWASAWEQVNTLRNNQGLARMNYYLCTNRAIARSFAVTYLRWLESSLAATLRRSPTCHELYAAWNLGPSGFRARGFSLARCPRRTRSAAQRVENLVRSHAPAGRTSGTHSPVPLLAGAF